MKNNIIIGIGFLICLFIFLPTVHADSGQLYKVDSETLELRNAPNQSATVLAELKSGEKVTILQESFGWGKTFYNGKEAWIALYLLDEKNESIYSMTSEVNEESAVETRDKEENQDVLSKQSGEKTLSGYHFVIDPGHGGKDTGAIRAEVYEKTLTLSTAKKVEEQLRDKGASVTLTRADDTFIPLEQRVQISNSTNTAAFISLHYNTFDEQSVRGIHTFYYDGDENQKLADSIQKSLINHINLADRGAKQANYQVLRDNKQLAILIELGLISNPEELKLVQTDRYQEKSVKGIVSGLEYFFK